MNLWSETDKEFEDEWMLRIIWFHACGSMPISPGQLHAASEALFLVLLV